MSDDMRPCPFCGGAVAKPQCFDSSDKGQLYAINCSRCVCCKTGIGADGALAAWNTRAADADIAALRAERDALQSKVHIAFERATNLAKERDALRTSEEEAGRKALHWELEWKYVAQKHDQLVNKLAALTREAEAALAAPDEAEVEWVAKAMVGDWDALAYYMRECYRIMARAAIAAFIAGRKS